MIKSISEVLNGPSSNSQYTDKRWIDRASNVRRQRGGFCQSCRRKGVLTHVHHVNYERGKNLWDYNDSDLAVLCEPCHALIHKSILAFRDIAGHSNAKNIAEITGLVIQLIKKHGDQGAALRIAELLQKQ